MLQIRVTATILIQLLQSSPSRQTINGGQLLHDAFGRRFQITHLDHGDARLVAAYGRRQVVSNLLHSLQLVLAQGKYMVVPTVACPIGIVHFASILPRHACKKVLCSNIGWQWCHAFNLGRALLTFAGIVRWTQVPGRFSH